VRAGRRHRATLRGVHGTGTASLKHDWTAHSVSFSPDGKVLASGGGGASKLWDLATGEARTLLTVDSDLEVYCVSFSPDGRTLAIGVGSRGFDGSNGEVKLWDMQMGRVRAVLKGNMGKVRSLAFAPDAKALVTGSAEAVVLWDLSPALSQSARAGTAKSF
jgi:WD40 repeat protein